MAEGNGKAVTAAVSTGALGLLAGFTVSPEMGFGLLKWLNESLGPVGFMAMLGLGSGLAVSVTGNWVMFKRMKEMADECRQETENQRRAWKAVVDEKHASNERTMGLVANMTEQVTLLAERARITNTRTRETG